MNRKTTCCRVCGAAVLYQPGKAENLIYLVCRSCQTAFQHPDFQPSVSYDATYYQPWQTGNHGIELTRQTKRLTFLSWLCELERFQPPGRILDVGCAMGFFLEAAQERGWEPYGVEVSPYAAGMAAEKFGKNFFYGELDQNPFPPGSFQVVTLLDVLEHLSQPHQAIQKAVSMLGSGGHLMLSTPDVRSLSSVFLSRWWFQRKPEHLFLFSRMSLELIMRRAGMEVCCLRPAWKWITIEFLESYARQYFPLVVQKMFAGALALLPAEWRTTAFRFGTGELLMIARKV